MTYECRKCGKEGLSAGYNQSGLCTQCQVAVSRKARYETFRRLEETTEPWRREVRKK